MKDDMNAPEPAAARLYDDAMFLYRSDRRHGAILLLLCAVDSLAKNRLPSETRNAERFEQFLRSKMRRPGRAQVHNIEVPRFNKLFTFEYIIYKFLRCPLVHEGSSLIANDNEECPVVLDWETIPRGIRVDGENDRVVLGGELVTMILVDAIQDELGAGGVS
jgi:hypothetical protein